MPREGTETGGDDVVTVVALECILCPVRGRKLVLRRPCSLVGAMHPMPREGTETWLTLGSIGERIMHPMPREGTETFIFANHCFPSA